MSEPIFRPMNQGDVEEALAIIHDHDEDDFAWASATYETSLQGQYILELDSQVVGVTGANAIEETDRTYEISWTYLTRALVGRRFGRTMLENLIEQIRSEGCRKAFVNTSNYYDPEDGDIYREAREAYRAVGFLEELRHMDFYAAGENLIAYGLRLENRGPNTQHDMNTGSIRLMEFEEIPECDGAYHLAWELEDEGSDVTDFTAIADQIKDFGGRVIFMAFPSDVENAKDFMTRCRFRKDGALLDYYEDGTDEVHFRYDIR